MEHMLISACLLGIDCKYDGGNNALPSEIIEGLKRKYVLHPVCPERDGGLPVPRDPSERSGDKVLSCKDADVTEEFEKGARLALECAQKNGCCIAILKERSPSCGTGEIYDGSFTGRVIERDGVTAELLKRNGIAVFGESEATTLI